MILNAKFYSLTLQTEQRRLKTQAEEQMRKPGGPKSTGETSNNKKYGVNHIDTAFLFNETTSEMKMFSAANSHMALLETGSLVTVL